MFDLKSKADFDYAVVLIITHGIMQYGIIGLQAVPIHIWCHEIIRLKHCFIRVILKGQELKSCSVKSCFMTLLEWMFSTEWNQSGLSRLDFNHFLMALYGINYKMIKLYCYVSTCCESVKNGETHLDILRSIVSGANCRASTVPLVQKCTNVIYFNFSVFKKRNKVPKSCKKLT